MIDLIRLAIAAALVAGVAPFALAVLLTFELWPEIVATFRNET